jgi:regulator of sirC expression with transglutaminase-like and TPR domain
MIETKEINALLTLIDDPDEEVFGTVSNKIIDFGKGIIPNLENLWENSPSDTVQDRIELLIHRLHYTDLTNDFKQWRDGTVQDLLSGALLVAKFQYPDLNTTPVLQDIEKIRRNVWLELNNYLTPLEQANVLSSIIFNYYRLKGVETNYINPDEFYLHKVLETKNGTAAINGIIYQIMCDLLDIKANIIDIPNQTILAFYASDYDAITFKGHPQEKILFYVDGINGQAYGHVEIENYFKKIDIKLTPKFLNPLSNKQIIKMLLEEISQCYSLENNIYKQQELLALANLLND